MISFSVDARFKEGPRERGVYLNTASRQLEVGAARAQLSRSLQSPVDLLDYGPNFVTFDACGYPDRAFHRYSGDEAEMKSLLAIAERARNRQGRTPVVHRDNILRRIGRFVGLTG